MDISIVEKYIKDRMIEDLVLYCKSLSSNDYAVLIELLINKLISYKIPQERAERNTVAYILGELKCNEAIPHIIELLKRDCYTTSIGSLVFALQKLDCVEYIEQIFHLFYVGNYEVRRNMFTLLEDNKEKISPDMYDRMKKNLLKAIEDYKDRLLGLYIVQDEMFYK